MAKVGRNQPCPCGSGQKYKKCCLHADTARGSVASQQAQLEESLAREEGPQASGMPGAYVIAKMFERSEIFATMKKKDPASARLFWTTQRIAGLETSDITTRLERLGVDASAEAFVELAEHRTSAWDLSDVWRERAGQRLDRHDNDFLGFAACELWKRYCPERPSVEMLDDWMQEGYELLEQGSRAEAMERWLRVWDVIASRLEPEMRTLQSASSVFEGSQCLFNWVQDVMLHLAEGASPGWPHEERAVAFYQAVVAQFTDEELNVRVQASTMLAEFYANVGRGEDSERVLLEHIEAYPHRAAGYVCLARNLAYSDGANTPAPELRRALAVLETAAAYPVENGDDYDLQLFLEHTRERLSKIDTGEAEA